MAEPEFQISYIKGFKRRKWKLYNRILLYVFITLWFAQIMLLNMDCVLFLFVGDRSFPIFITVWNVSECGVFSGPYFPAFRLNTLVPIQSECGNMRTRKNSVFGHFSRIVLLANRSFEWNIIILNCGFLSNAVFLSK